jgi:hypothetical protein
MRYACDLTRPSLLRPMYERSSTMLAYTAGDSLQAIALTFGVDSVATLEQKNASIEPPSFGFVRALWSRLFSPRKSTSRI